MRTVLTITADRGQHPRGFTLIEAALATIIVGVGITATMQLFETCTRDNSASTQMTTALLLAENIHELMVDLPFNDPASGDEVFGPEYGEVLETFNDLDDFDSLVLQPPVDASRVRLPQLSQYAQAISVMPVYPSQLSANSSESAPTIPKGTYTGALRVRVRILYQPQPQAQMREVYSLCWIRMAD